MPAMQSTLPPSAQPPASVLADPAPPAAHEAAHVASPAAPAADPARPAPARSRRSLLAAALGGLAGATAAALGRAPEARAAAGDPLVIGQDNFAGASGTHLFATSSGGAFWATQYGFGSGVRGDSVSGHGGVFTTQHGDRFGINASNTAAPGGTGSAINADGGSHPALRAATGAATTIIATSTGDYAIDASSPGLGATVHAFASSTTGQAVALYGVSWANNGFGVIGNVTSSSGVTRGIYGTSGSPDGVGVEGYNPMATGVKGSGGVAGVFGSSATEFGAGVEGTGGGTSGHGVVGGVSSDSGTASGVYGSSAGSTSYAAYFEGKVAVTGTLSKGGGSFRIDHPLDPANKILQHSFVESPDMLNIYNGNAVADTHGTATVRLPDWFMALNRDFRYSLTPIGEFAPLFVRSEVADGRFSIGGANPGQRVSWQVTGIRQDAWAEANRIQVELDKPADQRGRYLHPREHGQPASKGIDYAMQRRLAEVVARNKRTDAARPA